MITFNDFLNTTDEDSKKIFEFYLNYLTEFSSKDFSFDEQLKLKGSAGKFLNSIERTSYIVSAKKDQYLALLDDFQHELWIYKNGNYSFLIKTLIPNIKIKRLSRLQEKFQELFSFTLELINEASSKTLYFDDLKVNDFYKPDNSNKVKIKELINEAIDLIKEDDTLTEKSKKNIVEYLEKALKELESERVNWNRFLGRIKETVIVLGALGSFAGGVSTLFSAQEKLEQATIVVQKTSINFNFNVLNDTFNVQNIHHIGSINTMLELPDSSDIQEAQVIPSEKNKK